MNFEQGLLPTGEPSEEPQEPETVANHEKEESILETIRRKTGKIARGLAIVGTLATMEPGDKEEVQPYTPQPDSYSYMGHQSRLEPNESRYSIEQTEEKLDEDGYRKLLTENLPKALTTSSLYESERWFSPALAEIAGTYPTDILAYAGRFRHAPGADEVVHTAVNTILSWEKRHSLIEYADAWLNLPFAGEVIQTILNNADTKWEMYNTALDNSKFLSQFENGKKLAKEIIETTADKNNYYSIALHPDALPDEPWAHELLLKAAANEPEEFFDNAKELNESQYEEFIGILITSRPRLAAVKKPDAINSDGSFSGKFDEFLMNSKDPLYRTIYEIRKLGWKSTNSARWDQEEDRGIYHKQRIIGLFAEEIANGSKTIEGVSQLVTDPTRMFKALADLSTKPDIETKEAIEQELSKTALRNVEDINALHERTETERFASVEGFSSQQIYLMIVYGEEEIFTSTFNGLFDRTIKEMGKEEISGSQLLERAGFTKFRTFIRLCTEFNRLGDFLNTMPEGDRENILKKFTANLGDSKNPLREAVSIAEAINSISDPKTIEILENEIKKQLEVAPKNTAILYKLIASTFNEKGSNDEWLRDIEKEYQLPSLSTVESKDLFNRGGVNIQQYFFYNDDDGVASFQNFVAQYKNKQDWKIEDHKTYLTIHEETGGRELRMYANKPEAQDVGPNEIAKELEKLNVTTIVVVHRGHSYHAEQTIQRIPKMAKIVSLGSCGGYQNLSAVLERAPNAHVISTKGTGTKFVNDPLFKMLNEEILSGRDIEWSKFWTRAEEKLGGQEKFASYVPPNKNFGAMFIKAYEKATRDSGEGNH